MNYLSKNVTLSLSTVPERLSNTDDNLNPKMSITSLLNLTYENYEIHFNIPLINKRTGKEYHIPEWLSALEKENSKLKIFRCEDYGPPTKIIPTILRVNDPEAFIIVFDDDHAYEKDVIEQHLTKHEIYNNCVLGFAGLCSGDPALYFCTSVEKDTEVQLMEHYKSVSYRRKYFKDDFFEEFAGKSWNDDVLLGAYMGKHNIKKIVLNYDKETNFQARANSYPISRSVYHQARDSGCDIFRLSHDDSRVMEFIAKGYLDLESKKQ
jgi:hypothetical protein